MNHLEYYIGGNPMMFFRSVKLVILALTVPELKQLETNTEINANEHVINIWRLANVNAQKHLKRKQTTINYRSSL